MSFIAPEEQLWTGHFMTVQTFDINLVPVDRQEEGVKVAATLGF